MTSNSHSELFDLINANPPLIIVTIRYASASHLAHQLNLNDTEWTWVGSEEDLLRKLQGTMGCPYTEYGEMPTFNMGVYDSVIYTRHLKLFPVEELMKLVAAK